MKTVKRALALVLALTIILTLSIGAFAASGTNDNSGKITIDNAVWKATMKRRKLIPTRLLPLGKASSMVLALRILT